MICGDVKGNIETDVDTCTGQILVYRKILCIQQYSDMGAELITSGCCVALGCGILCG